MKRIISVILAVMMLLSCFAGLSFNAFAADPPQNGWYFTENEEWQYYKNGVAQTGWQQINSKWYYFDSDAIMFENDWYNINDCYYVFGKDGAMLSGGWVKLTFEYSDGYVETDWFYTKNNGICLEGWQKINNKWYYLNPYMYVGVCSVYDEVEEDYAYYAFDDNGAMVKGWYQSNFSGGIKSEEVSADKIHGASNWFYAGGDGKLVTGWQKINNVWYFFDEEDCYMFTGKNKIGEKYYFFNLNGKWINNGWCEGFGTWYYIVNGEPVSDSWKQINGKWYYFDGIDMVMGGFRIDGKDYLFDGNGAWIKNPSNGWHSVTATMTFYTGDKVTEIGWYYVKDGKIAEGWQKIGGKWYYFTPINFYYLRLSDVAADEIIKDYGRLGAMFYSISENIDGKAYAFGADGALITKTGWNKVTYPEFYSLYSDTSYDWVYVQNTGGSCKNEGFETVGGKTYYFCYDGTIYMNTVEEFDGDWIYFGADGAVPTKAGWQKVVHTYSYYGEAKTYVEWVYVDAKGVCLEGWQKIGGYWFFLDNRYGSAPYAVIDDWAYIDDQYYEFDKNGILVNPDSPQNID